MDEQKEKHFEERFGRKIFFFVKGLSFHNEVFGIVRKRFRKVFEGKPDKRRKDKPLFVGAYVGRYLDDINLLNQMICESRPSEVEHLERMTVENYYSTVDTWLRIIDEKNAAIENAGSSGEKDVKRSMSGKRTSSIT